MKKYVALKDMPFWKKGEVKNGNSTTGFIFIEMIKSSRWIYESEIKKLISDGWIAEYEEKKYSLEEIEKAYKKVTGYLNWNDLKNQLEAL